MTGDVVTTVDYRTSILRALCRRDDGPRQWEPLCDLADEAKFWLSNAEQLHHYPKNVVSLVDELRTAKTALGARCAELVGPAVETLHTELLGIATSRGADRHAAIRRALEAAEVVLALVASSSVRLAAWRDLVAAVSSETPDPPRPLGEFLESVVSRSGLDVRRLADGPPPTPECNDRDSWEQVVRYAEESLRRPHEEQARVVYTIIGSAAPGMAVERFGPLTFIGAWWLREILANPSSEHYQELPGELTTDDFFNKVDLRILPDDAPNDMVVARVELGPGPPDTAPSEARRLLQSVLSIASLHTRPGTWVVGDQYEYGMGWGHWDRPAGPSALVPGYIAEDLDRLRKDGRLSVLVEDARQDGAISRAATRLADIHSSVDADLKLAESVRTLELVFQGSGTDWREAARTQLADVWGARVIADWSCQIIQHAARELGSGLSPDHWNTAVKLLASDRLEMRSEVLRHSEALRGIAEPLQPTTQMYIGEVYEWLDDPHEFAAAATEEAEAFRRRMRRIERLRNGVTHVGRPPERVLRPTADSAHGFATFSCLIALDAQAQGMTLKNYLGEERRLGERFHRALQRRDWETAVSIV